MDNNYNNDPDNNGGQNNGNYPDSNNQYGGYDNGGQNYSGYPNNGQYNSPNYNGAPDFYSQMNYPYNQPRYESPDGPAIASLVLGLFNLLGWCLPIIGIPCGVVGIIMGVKGLKSSKKGMAVAGIVLSSVTLTFSLLNSILGVIGALRRYS